MKKKVLLVYDDFNEMTLTESYLKKVGIDVVGISNEALLSDQILSFNPDVVVSFRQKQKISSFSVSQKLKKIRSFSGKVIVIVQKGIRPSPEDMIKMRMDVFVEAPVSIERLLELLSKVMELDITLLKSKLQRTQNVSDKDKLISDPKRMAKYSEFLEKEGVNERNKIDVEYTSFQHDEVQKKQKDILEDWNFKEFESYDKLKRQFVRALFKKNDKDKDKNEK